MDVFAELEEKEERAMYVLFHSVHAPGHLTLV